MPRLFAPTTLRQKRKEKKALARAKKENELRLAEAQSIINTEVIVKEEPVEDTHLNNWNVNIEEDYFQGENVQIKMELEEEPVMLEADPLDDSGWKMETSGWSQGQEDQNWQPLKEFFICPYCHLADSSSNEKQMDFVELYYHLIFHHDFPLKCSQCKIFLPQDSLILNNHWKQFHSLSVETPPDSRFVEARVEMDVSSENLTAASIICPDCLKDEDLKVKFDSMKKFKIHQAVKHPSIARSSCPMCPLQFGEDNAAFIEHLQNVHNVYPKDMWRSYLCRYCGKGMENAGKMPLEGGRRRKCAIAGVFHILSSHLDLMEKVKFECKVCFRNFASFKEFIRHAKDSPDLDHARINLDYDVVNLCYVDVNKLTCGLCGTTMLTNVHSFLSHLSQSHFLSLSWKSGPLEVISSYARLDWDMSKGREIDGMIELCSVFQFENDDMELPVASFPREYKCPNCPELEGMNLDAFLVHLIFHWRRPNRCTSCKAYLPLAIETIDEHWTLHHPDSQESTTVKVEYVLPSSGDVFTCQSCSFKFSSHRERKEHQSSSYCRSQITTTTSCGVCSEYFANTEEVRIHKALDHPEITSVSCYYCEDQFPAELLEGGQYLDSEALHKHIREKEDHPKETQEKKFHLIPCDHCGIIIEDDYKYAWRVRAHVLKDHGPVAGKHKPISCYICNSNLPYDGLWKHLSSEHAKKCNCETCGKEMKPRDLPTHNLLKHNIVLEGYQTFFCEREGCGFKSLSSIWYKRHVTMHQNKDMKSRYKCSICGKAYDHLSNLKIHEHRYHNAEPPPRKYMKREYHTSKVEIVPNNQALSLIGRRIKSSTHLWLHERRKKIPRKDEATEVACFSAGDEITNSVMDTSGKYKCPNCPDLKMMSLEAFLVHLIFHWRRPNRCTSCKAYLPLSLSIEAIDEHWSIHHTDLESLKEAKLEKVQACAGDVFSCQNCPLKFRSNGERKEHESSSHECGSTKTESCDVCNESFINTEEVRIHKALDHPEIASVSCYYCEEKFPADLLEGGQYRDCEALHKHIQEKADHPEETQEKKFHLIPCDYCGLVIEDDYRFTWRVRAHVVDEHGPVAGKHKPISCYICDCNLPYDGLWKHLSSVHAKKSACETCGEEMMPRMLPTHNLLVHDIVLEGYQKFSCEWEGCGFKSLSSTYYKRHVAVHKKKDRQSRYKCLFCTKAFPTTSGLKLHEKVHHQKQQTLPV